MHATPLWLLCTWSSYHLSFLKLIDFDPRNEGWECRHPTHLSMIYTVHYTVHCILLSKKKLILLGHCPTGDISISHLDICVQQKKELLTLFVLILGHFWCLVVTSVTFSSNLAYWGLHIRFVRQTYSSCQDHLQFCGCIRTAVL